MTTGGTDLLALRCDCEAFCLGMLAAPEQNLHLLHDTLLEFSGVQHVLLKDVGMIGFEG